MPISGERDKIMNEDYKHIGGVLKLIAEEFACCERGATLNASDIRVFAGGMIGLARILDVLLGDYERLKRFEAEVLLQQRRQVGRALLEGANVVMLRARAGVVVLPSGGDDAA